jgi:hypothetical protein
MEFEIDEDVYYLYLDLRGEKSVMKLQRDYGWSYDTVDGILFDLGMLPSQLDIDEIVLSLERFFDGVELIDEMEIDNYIG